MWKTMWKINRSLLMYWVLVALAIQPNGAHAVEEDATAITIYSSAQPGAISPNLYRPLPGGRVSEQAVPGYAVVRHDRTIHLDPGYSTLKFTDVAGRIDPATVTFTSLTDPATRVLEQNFQFDLVSTDAVLLRYIDKPITVEQTVGNQRIPLTGTLLSATDRLLLQGEDGVLHAINNYAALHFPKLPGGLITQPTLVWNLHSPRGGEHRSRVTYQTDGVTWWADYNLLLHEGADAESGTLDLAAWVSILNQSGATYSDARLKLVAGDIHRAEAPQYARNKEIREMAALAQDGGGGFAEKPFFEFHLYTLGRKTTLPNNSTKQIELFEQARHIPAKKILLYDGLAQGPSFYSTPFIAREFASDMNKKVDAYLEFKNDAKSGLCMPLPAGRIRVSKVDFADGSLELIGEDTIDHTPKGETVRIKLGSAFDVVGERRQTDFSIDTSAHWLEEEVEVKLRNHKDQDVTVVVKENLFRWSMWKVVAKTHAFSKEDARTIHFPVRVAKGKETTLRYRVRYTW